MPSTPSSMLVQPSKPARRSSLKIAEDRVIIVQSLADLAVTQSLGIARGAAFLASEILQCPCDQVTVAGMHRDDAVGNPPEQLDWIIASLRIAGVVIDAEAGVVNRVDQRSIC